MRLESLALQDLYFMKNQAWHTLEEVYLSKNLIHNIDILCNYQNLRVIDASSNYIEEVNLYLPKLESLNLSNNYLKKFPILENMKKLKSLNLNSNELQDFKDVMPHLTPNIRTLDMGNNQLSFENLDAFNDFIDKLQKFSQLRILVVSNNRFQDDCSGLRDGEKAVQDELIKSLKKLEFLNGDDTATAQRKLEEQNPTTTPAQDTTAGEKYP